MSSAAGPASKSTLSSAGGPASKLTSLSTSNLSSQSASKATSGSLSQGDSEAISALVSFKVLGKRVRQKPVHFTIEGNASSKRPKVIKKRPTPKGKSGFYFERSNVVKAIHDLDELKEECNKFFKVFTWDGKVVRIDWEKVINIHSSRKDLLNVVFKLMEQTNIAVIFKNVMAAGYEKSNYSVGKYILDYFKNSNRMPLRAFPSSFEKNDVDLFLDEKNNAKDVESGKYYLKDIDLGKLDGTTVDKFWEQFQVPEVKLGSTSCLFGVYCKDALPKLGPLIYLTKSATINPNQSHGTRFHFDGKGELDAAHIVLKGKNRVILFERTHPIYNEKLQDHLKYDDWRERVDDLQEQG